MKKLQYILFLFSAVFCYSQVSLVPLIDDKEYKVNQKFTLTFILEISGENMVQQTALRLPDFSKFERLGSGSEQNTLFLDNVSVNQIVFQQVLMPKSSGNFKIGSATVTVNGKIYKTEPFDIYVAEADKNASVETPAKLKNDLYLNVEVDDTEVYQNQPVVAVLRAYSRNINNFRKVKNVKLPSQNQVEFCAVSYKKSDIEFSKNNVSSQVLAVYLIFPEKSGRFEMQPAMATYSADAKKLLSNKVNIKVKDLPANAPQNYKNAVGDFNIDFSTTESEKIQINKPINVKLTISGEGNMENLQLPTIKESPDYDVFQPKILKSLNTGETGIKGEIIIDYIVIPKKSGVFSILTDSFSFFNPKVKEYTDLGTQKLEVNVVSQEEILADRTPLERVNAYSNNVLETVDNPVITTKTLKVEQNGGIDWKTSLLNFILFVSIIGIFLIVNNRQKNKKKIIDNLPKPLAFSASFETEKISEERLENTFGYLRRMLRERNFEEVFVTISDLDNLFRNSYKAPSNSNFAEILEKVNGSKIGEEYRTLAQKIQIEKYAPVKNEEQLNDLVESIITFYSKIAK